MPSIGTGTFYLNLTALETDFQNQSLQIQVQILPRDINLQLGINGTDCTNSKLYTISMNNIMNVSVRPTTVVDGAFIPNANLTLSDSGGYTASFNQGTDCYWILVNSTLLNAGIHFLSAVFLKTDYESSVITIQLTIQQLILNSTLLPNNSIAIQTIGSIYNQWLYIQDNETGQPITDAQVSYIWAFGSDNLINYANGTYQFNLTIPFEPGTYPIEINIVPDLNYEAQNLQTLIEILPKAVNLQVFINNQNCTVNASYTIYMNQLMNITVIPLTSPEMIFIPNASVSLSDSNGLQLVFIPTSSAYYVELNSTALNVGTHFMSFIFSDQNYQSMAITMQITVQQIKLHAQINHMNSTLTQDTSTQYSVMINVEDSATNLPIIDANVSYSWAFGTGFLSNLGNGSYSFNSTIPSQPGTYFIQITIVPNINYEIQTIQFIIVATTPSTSSNAWIMVDGLGILIVLVLIGVVIKQNIINPKRYSNFGRFEKPHSSY